MEKELNGNLKKGWDFVGDEREGDLRKNFTKIDTELDDINNKISNLSTSSDLNKRQLEQLLLFSVQQQTLLENILRIVDNQNLIISRLEQTQNTTSARTADMTLNLDRMDETIQEIQQLATSLPNEFQEIKNAIANIRIYQSVDNYNNGLFNNSNMLR